MPQSLKTQLNLNQSLKMTAWLQQSIKLLTLSRLELKEAVEQELLSNPLLENEEGSYGETDDSSKETKESENDTSDSYSQMEEYSHYNRRNRGNNSDNAPSFENFIPEPETLKSHLEWQAQVSPLSNEDKCLVFLLISHLNEKGYLNTSLEELMEQESLSQDELEKALFVLQSMDPSGIGARDIRECLLIQTRSFRNQKEDLTFIIKNHLHNLERQNYKVIAQDLKKPLKETKKLCQMIMSFNPAPAKNFSTQPVSYIIPDIYIYKEGNEYKTRLHRDSFPKLTISLHYKKNIHIPEKHKKDMKKYFQEKTHSGQYFIRSLQQRKDIITKVMNSLIKYQREFFDTGPSGLKHIILKDVANDIGVHPSTVSRATANKYVHTPRGIFSLKYFFSVSRTNSIGQNVSMASIKTQIKEWVSKEDPTHPLSDSSLTNKIHNHFQVKISRRVVSKYRESLGLLSSMKRRKRF